MKSFHRLIAGTCAFFIAAFVIVNLCLTYTFNQTQGNNRPDRIELNRIVQDISKNGEKVSLSQYKTILGVYELPDNPTVNADTEQNSLTNIPTDNTDFFTSKNDYIIRQIEGKFYRIEYQIPDTKPDIHIYLIINLALLVYAILLLSVLLYIRNQIIKPFHDISTLPYELSKGNLTIPLKENKNKFFGRFLWGLDMLRETLEQSRQRELALQKEKKTLLLSLSHDIKTPLSAIKLYAKALSRQLYSQPNQKATQEEKQLEIAGHINAKADEIEAYVQDIIQASSEDFLQFEVKNSEFYQSYVIEKIHQHYSELLSHLGTSFEIQNYEESLLKGDAERLVEVLQNIMENAIKYGDAQSISIQCSDEENCRLITIKNSGCTLPEIEIDHMFESFWRGSNSANQKGSGLGLYICRQLMNGMGGEIFAEVSNGCMAVTVVCVKA